MSLQHLHYVLNEIVTTAQVLSIKNTTFFKRSIARLIAMRIDDYIKLGFSTNKQGENKQVIRDELNALQTLYIEHFKLQRDKYGAHFQHLSFSERLQNWSEINAARADFFTEMPIDIYGHFSSATGYIPFSQPILSPDTISTIEKINDRFDLEKIPNISTDILSLTRPNSGGILNFTMIHTKAGVLKSLELLIDYEWEMIEGLKGDHDTSMPFIKLFLADLLSYLDNYFTRTDISSTSPQYEEGFDHYITIYRNDWTKEANEIISKFKTGFKLDDHISELRRIRNKTCGHIDTTLTMAELNTLVNNVDLGKFHDLYLRLKAIFRSVCFSTIHLKHYLFDPFEKLYGVDKIVGMEVSSFDGQPFPETPSQNKSPNEDHIYKEQYRLWLSTGSDAARSYFWHCFHESEAIEKIEIAIPNTGSQGYRYHEFRKAHKFFEDKLLDDNVAKNEKVAIINLFQQCRSGDPETLAYILVRTFPRDLTLRAYYIEALGQLSMDRSEETLQRCLDFFNSTNLKGKSIVVRALFRIDISARRRTTGKHDTDISNYSTLIKSILTSELSLFEQLSLSLVLLSDYIFGQHHLSDSLDNFYKEFFITCYLKFTNQLLSPFLKDEISKKKLIQIQDLIRTNRFATLVGIFSNFLDENNKSNEAKILRTLVVQEYIQYSRYDNQELHNLAVIYLKTGDLETALNIAKFLTQKNAHKVDYNYLLLDLYRHDEKYKAEFDVLKSKILSTFNLSNDERLEFESMKMVEQKSEK